MPTRGVSGLGVSVAAIGAYVMYAAVRDVPLLDGARQLIRGEVPTSRRPSGQATWIEDIAANPAGSAAAGAGSAAAQAAFGTDTASNAGPAGSVIGDRVVNAARRYLGRPYVWGGTFQGSGGGDCSGLVLRAFTDAGVTGCPRTSGQIAVWGKLRKVPREQVAPGDVLWWAGHVAIAVGGTQMIEAPTRGVPVRIAPIRKQNGVQPLVLRYGG
jgi:cell wall-associated NlpC family hydrolase